MAELGYREGENYTFDYVRTKSPSPVDYEAGFREVVAHNPDLLLAAGTEVGLKSALAVSSTIPIVKVAIGYDPVAQGYASSLARPGGRITGLYVLQLELAVKRLQLFKDAIRDLSSAIVFYEPGAQTQWMAAKGAAAQLGLRLFGIDLGYPPFNFEAALSETPPGIARNLCVLDSPRFTLDRKRLAEFALRSRLPSMFPSREFADAGGLLAYGPNIEWTFARSAEIVDRIARGAKPAELPIEQPTKIEFVINLATARALQIDLAPELLARADEVVE